jgi:NTE family protein
VVARVRTSALELDADVFESAIAETPRILLNMVRMLGARLAQAHARRVEPTRGETIALAAGPALADVRAGVIAAAQRISPRPITALGREFSFAGAVTAADDLVSGHTTVFLVADLEPATLAALLGEVDRVVAFAGGAADVALLERLAREERDRPAALEVVLVGDEAASVPTGLPGVRRCGRPPGAAEFGWLARHLTRTKLGLALGAGGAKGYAHVGVLEVLERAGYVVDFVSGSSIGAIVATFHALGADAAEIDSTLRGAFDPTAVAEIFRMSLGGATGIDTMTRLLRETTRDLTFADTLIPLTVMTVDLTDRAPAPLREGLLWQALLAATALPGMFPPHERGSHRLVDGLALVPVPTGALLEDGADITVSVNLMSEDTLEAWPDGPVPEPPPERRRRPGMLDTLLEVMDLSQLQESVRHAELADVAITPRFGPCHWRDFDLANQFLLAGRKAAEEQLPQLRSLALPATADTEPNHEGGGLARADAIRI